jgi:hypothetical protein
VKIYWQNLLSLRMWVGVFLTPLAFIVALTLIGVPVAAILWLYWPLAALMGYLFLTRQLVCNACGRGLSTTRINGEQLVCRHCQTPTDKAVKEAAMLSPDELKNRWDATH